MSKVVKICGIRTEEAANCAIESGVDLLGVILVPNRKRTVDHDVAKKISLLASDKRKTKDTQFKTVNSILKHLERQSFLNSDQYFIAFKQLIIDNGPFLVGVFRNQDISDVFKIAGELSLDFIQLHGNEDKEKFCQYNSLKESCTYGIIPRFVIPKDIDVMDKLFTETIRDNVYVGSGLALPLLDSELGGEGKTIDWKAVDDLKKGKFILAGGLNPSNVQSAFVINNVIGFDVSGGVEDEDGNKDLMKIESFIKAVKEA